jgi:hypothetical protein
MQRAKEMLTHANVSIAEVCKEVGYSSQATFTRHFNLLIGMSPNEFRHLPRRLCPELFVKAVWHYLHSERRMPELRLEGVVEGASKLKGYIVICTFGTWAAQGMPLTGTLLQKPGVFCVERPELPHFHLMAAYIPETANLKSIMTSLPVEMIARQAVGAGSGTQSAVPHLSLRPIRLTDPPIVMVLPALPPWRGLFSR